MANCERDIEINNREQGKVLVILLGINTLMFLVEITLGIFSESTALIADSMDMLADATIYGIALYAVGRAGALKIRAAFASGILQLLFGVIVAVDVLRRLIWGSDPQSLLMIAVGLLALIANTICLSLIAKHREGEVHMRASWIFSKNDVIANLGIILGGGLVYLLDSRFPDLIIGLMISILVMRGGLLIIKEAKGEL